MIEKQEACQLYIEQEIEAGLADGKSKYAIGQEIAGWIEKLFGAQVKPNTITQRAHRFEEKLMTNVTNGFDLDSDTQDKIVKLANEIQAEKKQLNQKKRMSKRVERDQAFKKKPLPDRKYGVLYIDPPWRYEYSISKSRDIENQYPTMTLEEIKAININKIADKDCVLFMWATSPKLPEAIEVLSIWEFTYKTCAVWVKDKIGMGYYFRQQHELLLVATKGEPVLPAPTDRMSSVLSYPRTTHSTKPIEIYNIIDNMYPNIIKLELFSRSNKRNNWEKWGYEA